MKLVWQLPLVVLFYLTGLNLNAQVDSTWQQSPNLKITGFTDVFYVYDFNQPEGTERQAFLFNHNRHNEFNINLGLVKLAIEHSKYRANLALQTGTYANDNYAAEPGLLKSIFEANVGISLNKPNTLWIDAGVLPSHIGFESAISMDNMTLTRSLLAENSPYFLTGVKLTYHPSDRWDIAGLLMNGWQRIQRLEGNSILSFGTQVNFRPNDDITLNWSTFIGTDDPDTSRRMRYFNNLYGQFKLGRRLNIIAGFDLGIQQKAKSSSEYDIWLSPIFISQFTLNDYWSAAIRAEYYQDHTGIIIPTENLSGFQTTGLSLNFDYSPQANIVCRLEGRWLQSGDAVFDTNSSLLSNNFIIASSIAIKFSEYLRKRSL